MVTTTDRVSQIDTAIFEPLRAALRGPLLVNGDPAYEEARPVYNGMIHR